MSKPHQPDPIEYIAENPKHHVAPNAVMHLVPFAKETGRRTMGQINIEVDGNPSGVYVFYTVFPSGDFFCWFIESLHLFLVVLVDENIKTVKVAKMDDMPKFTAEVASVADQLNIKNHYPVDCGNAIMGIQTNPNDENS